MAIETTASPKTYAHITAFFVGIIAPFLVFLMLYVSPLGEIVAQDYFMHSLLLSTMVLFSFMSALYCYRFYTAQQDNHHLFFLSSGMAAFGGMTLVHLLVTFLLLTSARYSTLFDVTEHFGIYFAALLSIGVVIPLGALQRAFLHRYRVSVYVAIMAVLAAFVALVWYSASTVAILYSGLPAVTVGAGILLLLLSAALVYQFSHTREVFLIYVILGFAFVASSSYVPFFYSDWSVLWWYRYLLIATGFTTIFIGIINYHRRDLTFRLFIDNIPFYKKIGTKFALVSLLIGLMPLAILSLVLLVSTGSFIEHLSLGGRVAAIISVPGSLYLQVFRIALTIAVLVVVVMFFSFFYASKLIMPLKELRDAVDKMAAGDDEVHIDAQTGDEIGMLATSFNTMALNLRELHRGLDILVREKTAELSIQMKEVQNSKLAILNLLQDIDDEKKKIEETVRVRTHELNDEKARLLASINSISFGFVIVDSQNTILIKNPALNKILDIANDPQTLGDIAKYLEGIDLELSCKQSVAQNGVVEHKNIPYGKKFLRVFCAPVLEQSHEESHIIGNVVLIEDITEAKVMERSRDEFFAVASHELRTPLTAIRGNADMILEMYAEKIVDKDMKEMLQDINSSSVRLIAIVNDFLEVSRLEQGKIEMKLEKFNPAEVIEKVVRDLKEMIGKKGLALVYSPPNEPLPDVMGDRNRVEQILVNFIGNSTKFTKEGSISISVEREDAKLRFRVSDTGSGISEHNQSLLFRKFQQAGEQMLARDVSQSTGLGLYICKLIVTNMGGDIGLEKSELGKGSTFFFTIPIAA